MHQCVPALEQRIIFALRLVVYVRLFPKRAFRYIKVRTCGKSILAATKLANKHGALLPRSPEPRPRRLLCKVRGWPRQPRPPLARLIEDDRLRRRRGPA